MFSNFYIKGRIEKADLLRELGKNPYSNNAHNDLSNATFIAKYEADALDSEAVAQDSATHAINDFVAGRVKLVRLMGKAAFIDRQDIDRLLRIVDLLVQWNLVTVEKSRYKPDIKDHVGIFVLSRSELSDWELVPKYKIGSKHFQK